MRRPRAGLGGKRTRLNPAPTTPRCPEILRNPRHGTASPTALHSYYGDGDYAHSNWVLRAGVEYYPLKSNTNSKKYMDYIKYRTGFYFGPEYIVTTVPRNNFTITGGFSLPLTTPRYIQTRGEYVTLNTSVEVGSRSNNDLQGIKENYTRINLGVSMNARWFQKRSYD